MTRKRTQKTETYNQRLGSLAPKRRHQSRRALASATSRNNSGSSRSSANPLGLGSGADRLAEIPPALAASPRLGGIRRKQHSSPYVATLPEEPKQFVRPTLEEQFRLALPVLLAAREDVKRGEPLVVALRQTGTIVDVYARRVCQAAIWNFEALVAAEVALSLGARVALLRSDALRALDRAIRLSRAKQGRRGGWRVGR